jgi:1,4-alpha-glucan branching enzyme
MKTTLRKMLMLAMAALVVVGATSCAGVLGAIEDRLPPPHEVDGGILFRFFAPAARQVTLAGSFNAWGGTETGRYQPEIDQMTDPDSDGVWTIVKPLAPGRYQYKFVVDGGVRWEEDPSNPDVTDDGYGGFNSLIVVPPTVDYEYETVTGTVTGSETRAEATPSRSDSGVEVTLSLDRPDAGEVFVAGTFNQWDPTADALTKGSDGIWRTTIELEPGSYEYKFVIDGNWEADPENPESVPDPYGGENSVLTVE